jgi:hypothetical protein
MPYGVSKPGVTSRNYESPFGQTVFTSSDILVSTLLTNNVSSPAAVVPWVYDEHFYKQIVGHLTRLVPYLDAWLIKTQFVAYDKTNLAPKYGS